MYPVSFNALQTVTSSPCSRSSASVHSILFLFNDTYSPLAGVLPLTPSAPGLPAGITIRQTRYHFQSMSLRFGNNCPQFGSGSTLWAFSTKFRVASNLSIASANISVFRRVVRLRDSECCRLTRCVVFPNSFLARSSLDFKPDRGNISTIGEKLLSINFHSDFEQSSRASLL